MDSKLERLVQWVKRGRAGPSSVEIWPTNRCNLKCLMCGTWASRRKLEAQGIPYDPKKEAEKEIPTKIWLGVVKEAVKLGVVEFLITGGGEPMVRRDTTLKLMKEIKRRNAWGNINTNGTLLSRRDVQKIVEMGWDMMMFSIDGPNSEIHDTIRNVNGTFKKVKKVLNWFKSEKKRLGKEKPKISFNSVVMQSNFRFLDRLVEFAAQVDCESITFIPLIVYDNFVKKLALKKADLKDFSKVVKRVKILAKELQIHTNVDELSGELIDTSKMDKLIYQEIERLPKGKFTSLACFEPFLHLLVMPDGKTTCCCMLAGRDEVWLASKGIVRADNVIEKNLRDIWWGDYLQALREKLLRREIPTECGTCVFSQFLRNKKIRSELQRASLKGFKSQALYPNHENLR